MNTLSKDKLSTPFFDAVHAANQGDPLETKRICLENLIPNSKTLIAVSLGNASQNADKDANHHFAQMEEQIGKAADINAGRFISGYKRVGIDPLNFELADMRENFPFEEQPTIITNDHNSVLPLIKNEFNRRIARDSHEGRLFPSEGVISEAEIEITTNVAQMHLDFGKAIARQALLFDYERQMLLGES